MSDTVGGPADRFSHDAAHFIANLNETMCQTKPGAASSDHAIDSIMNYKIKEDLTLKVSFDGGLFYIFLRG